MVKNERGGDIIFTARDLLVQYSAQNRTKSLRVLSSITPRCKPTRKVVGPRTLDLYKRTCLFDWADLGGQKRK